MFSDNIFKKWKQDKEFAFSRFKNVSSNLIGKLKTVNMYLVVQIENSKNKKCVTLTKNALCNQYVSFFFNVI